MLDAACGHQKKNSTGDKHVQSVPFSIFTVFAGLVKHVYGGDGGTVWCGDVAFGGFYCAG